MKVWASMKSIRAEVADVPENWLLRFATKRPGDIRKMGDSVNSTLLFRSAAVLDAIEAGELKRAAPEKKDELGKKGEARKAVGA